MKNYYRILPLLLAVSCVIGGVRAASDTTDGLAIEAEEISRILALSDDYEYGEYLAGECASCHLAKAVETSDVPVIHGAEPEHIVRALLEFRAGLRENTTMGLVANGLGNEEIAAIAHYLAASQ